MTADAIREVLYDRPFVPFRIHMGNGRMVEVKHPEMAIVTDGTSGELRATICWTDPPGTSPGNVLNSPIKMLVNDLDLRIEQTSTATTHQPWVLDPANPALPATRGALVGE